MKTNLLKQWNLMRLFRLAIGAWAIIAAFGKRDPLLGVMGAILFVVAVMNIGCFGANDCKAPSLSPKTIPTHYDEEIDFEEIK
jgi:hypothetical protein